MINSGKKINILTLVLSEKTFLIPNIYSILWKHMNTLHRSEELKESFPTPPLVAYRRDQNLQEIIINKKHNNMFYKKPNICEHCGKNWALCKYISIRDTFIGTDGKEYKVKGYINCKTSNLIYSVRCKKCCKMMYVGQTGDTFYQRMLLNFSRIRTRKHDNVAEHFLQ